MKASRMVVIIALLFWLIPVIAQAQEINRKGPCRADIEKFCKDVKPGQGRIVKCMQAHEAELSPVCKNHIEEAKEQMQEFKKDCSADVNKFCKDVKPGKGRMVRCLKGHQAELSPVCGAHFHKK